MADKWRVGSKVPVNIYKNDVIAGQCQSPELAAEIVEGMNRAEQQPSPAINDLAVDWIKRNYSDEQDEEVYSFRWLARLGFIAGYQSALARTSKRRKRAK